MNQAANNTDHSPSQQGFLAAMKTRAGRKALRRNEYEGADPAVIERAGSARLRRDALLALGALGATIAAVSFVGHRVESHDRAEAAANAPFVHVVQEATQMQQAADTPVETVAQAISTAPAPGTEVAAPPLRVDQR